MPLLPLSAPHAEPGEAEPEHPVNPEALTKFRISRVLQVMQPRPPGIMSSITTCLEKHQEFRYPIMLARGGVPWLNYVLRLFTSELGCRSPILPLNVETTRLFA